MECSFNGGPIELGSRGTERRQERKVDQVLCELVRYDVFIDGALHQTKWFGCGVYEVGEGLVLARDKNVPIVGERVHMGGVALVLRGQALAAWKRGGQQ